MKNNSVLVSVLVSCYNHERYVEEAILSIVNQTYPNIELIVIDDGSKDSSPSIIQNLSDKYGFYYAYQSNIGFTATLNKMIKMAKGDLICMFASDDVMAPFRVEELTRELLKQGNACAMVAGDAGFIDGYGKTILWHDSNKSYKTYMECMFSKRPALTYSSSEFGDYHTLLHSNYISAGSVLVRKEALFNVGLYDENILLEDWDMWLKLARNGYFIYYYDKVVSYYRWHDANTVKTLKKKIHLDMLKLIRRELGYCLAAKTWDFKGVVICIRAVVRLSVPQGIKERIKGLLGRG